MGSLWFALSVRRIAEVRALGKMARRGGESAEGVASWGAGLRFGTAESQDESPCRAIHKSAPTFDMKVVADADALQSAAVVLLDSAVMAAVAEIDEEADYQPDD